MAVTDGARLARQTAAGHGADHVILTGPGRRHQRLLNHHPQHWTSEIDFDFAGVDGDLAGAGLDPDPGDRVLALAGGVGTALLVDLLDVFRRFSGAAGFNCDNWSRDCMVSDILCGPHVLAIHRSDVDRLGLLGLVRMLRPGVNA